MDIEYSSRGFLTAFFRQRTPFVAISLAIFLSGLAYLIITTPVYESSGNLVVKFGQGPQADTDSGGGVDTNTRQEIINSYIKIITSRDFLRESIQAFGVYRLYPELQDKSPPGTTPETLALNNLLERDLKITGDQSRMIDVRVRSHDPAVAAGFAVQVLNAFIGKRTEIYNLPPRDVLQRQAEDARQELEKARNKYQEFKQNIGISDPEQEMSQLLREKGEISTLAYTAITREQSKLADLEAQAAKMETTYRPESTLLAGLRNTIRSARENLRLREKDLSAGDGSADNSLSSTLAKINKRLAYLETHKSAYNDLQQQVKIREEIYLKLQKQSEDARIAHLLNGKNISHIGIVDNPAVPFKPVKPQKKIFLALTLLAAVISGFGAMLSRELLDDRLSNPDQVLAHIGVPVLAAYRNEISYDPK